MSTGQFLLVMVVVVLSMLSITAIAVWGAVYLVRTISGVLSETLRTSFQTATSPGEVEQATPTWQTLTTVPWEDWERPMEETTQTGPMEGPPLS
jgi:hypothetical protein